tara:strand:+ start:1181 stop:1795 length:615 start_codon:yes stop_codon:yes gene_type:complete
MPLFGRNNDRKLIKHFSKEVMSDIIDTPVVVYKPYITKSNTNLYGEGVDGDKAWRPGIVLNALINREDQEYQNQEYGIDLTQKASFSFLNEDILQHNKLSIQNSIDEELSGFIIEIGDLIYYDAQYWEIDSTVRNQYMFGRNNNTINNDAELLGFNSNDDMHGEDFSTVAQAHLTRRSKLNIEEPNNTRRQNTQTTNNVTGLYR